MGFRHTGIHDGYVGSQRPTMSTCQPTSESDVRNSLSRDDEAAIQWATDSVFSNFHTFTPNPSFEETPGTQYWNANNGLTFSTSTAGGGVNGTPSYAVIRQYQDTSHLALTTRWVAGGNVGPDSWDDITIYARINVRKAVSVSQGNVRVRHVYRTVNYPGFTELCQFPEDENGDGIDLNSDQTSGPILGPWTYSDPADCPPQYTTSWTESCDTQHEYLNSTLTIDAWDVRINVYPRMTGTFSPFPPVDVHVDRTRVMVND